MAANCPFCLENNQLRVPKLAESDGAFLIVAQNFPGCYLIIPKSHAESPAELPDTWWADFKQMLAAVPDMSEHYNLSLNVGKHAGQTVKHLHFWVVPREAGVPATGKGLATLIQENNDAN